MRKKRKPVRQSRNLALSRPQDVKSGLRLLMPLRTLLVSYAAFAVGLLIIPAQAAIGFTGEAFVFLLLSITAAAVGLLYGFGGRINTHAIRSGGDRFAWNTGARRCIYISSLGIGLAIIDRYVIRGVPFSADIFEARSALEDTGAGPVAIVAAFFSSFAAFGVITVWLANAFQQPVGKKHSYLAFANLLVYLALSISLGSRSLFLVCIFLHLFAIAFLRRAQGQRLSAKAVAAVLLIPLLIAGALVSVMLERLNQMGLAPMDSIQLSTYAYALEPTNAALGFLAQNEFLETVGAATYSLILYFFHGFYEVLLLVDTYRGDFTYGQQLLWMPIKLVGIVAPLPPLVDLEQFSGYRSGIFTTFAGPFFIDFGLFAPLFIFLTFAFMAMPYRRLVRGDLRWFVAALQIIVIVVFAPIMPLLQSAVGTYLLIAAIAIVFLVPEKK